MQDLNVSMFRAYDIRTPSHLLTDSLAERLTAAEAVYFRDALRVSGVLVAHDARITGPRYLEIGVDQFLRAGLNVLVVPGVCSTSQFYFAAMRYPEYAAVMFGASHNPAGDTGQKILGPGVRPIAESIGPAGGLDRIKELHLAGASRTGARGTIKAYDPTAEYIDYSMRQAGVSENSLSGLRLFHDYLNGAAGREMMLALNLAGADLTPLHFAADGNFPLGDPNPVKQAVIKEGIETLKSGDFLLGCFFDGDGDRLDVYRGDGTYLSSSFVYAGILPLIAEHAPEGAGVFADLKSNPLAIMEMARAGFRVKVIRNGHSQIKNAIYDDPAMKGAVEESAHFYESFTAPAEAVRRIGSIDPWPRFATENTLYVALQLARAWSENPDRFDHLFEIQAQTSREREWGYKFPSDDMRSQALDAVQAHFEAQGLQAKSRMDNGYDLEATMMRRGIPFEIDASTTLQPAWLQVCQRISQSETGLARWEAVAADADIAAQAKADIAGIVTRFGAGNEYQG